MLMHIGRHRTTTARTRSFECKSNVQKSDHNNEEHRHWKQANATKNRNTVSGWKSLWTEFL